MVLTALLLYGTYTLMSARTYQVTGELISRVHTDQKLVALTFDDGPTPRVQEILPLLNRYQAKATFFLVGSELEKQMELGKAIVREGHQLGNHTYSHERMIFKSPSFIKEEVDRTHELIRQAGYEGEIMFRPPYGKKLFGLPYYLQSKQLRTIMWDLEPDTYYSSSKDKVDYVTSQVKPGSIILLHPMYDKGEGLAAIEGILKALTLQGYRFVTIEELLAAAQ
jgi:peptidoglycan-N-acetylglucosamine deacetylase